MRARTRHRGDEWEVGDRNCLKAYLRSFAFNARDLVVSRGDPACVDCGSECSWDADHDIPLWEGGEHSPANLVRRCDACHKAKTKKEAGRRAALRRNERGVSDPESEQHPGQATLLDDDAA